MTFHCINQVANITFRLSPPALPSFFLFVLLKENQPVNLTGGRNCRGLCISLRLPSLFPIPYSLVGLFYGLSCALSFSGWVWKKRFSPKWKIKSKPYLFFCCLVGYDAKEYFFLPRKCSVLESFFVSDAGKIFFSPVSKSPVLESFFSLVLLVGGFLP